MFNSAQVQAIYKLSTNGLEVTPEFPIVEYEAVHSIVSKKQGLNELYDHYVGAWNSIAYRYRGAIENGSMFVNLITKYGSTPAPQERYLQEKAIFEFFSSGFSVFESTFYGLYSIGALIDPTNFALSSPKDQQHVSPISTKQAYEKVFAGDPILLVFDRFFADPDYQRWREIRNILTHRTAPGRRIYVSIGHDDAPPVEWKLNNTPLNTSIASDGTRELSRLLAILLGGTATFVKTKL